MTEVWIVVEPGDEGDYIRGVFPSESDAATFIKRYDARDGLAAHRYRVTPISEAHERVGITGVFNGKGWDVKPSTPYPAVILGPEGEEVQTRSNHDWIEVTGPDEGSCCKAFWGRTAQVEAEYHRYWREKRQAEEQALAALDDLAVESDVLLRVGAGDAVAKWTFSLLVVQREGGSGSVWSELQEMQAFRENWEAARTLGRLNAQYAQEQLMSARGPYTRKMVAALADEAGIALVSSGKEMGTR